MDWRTTSELALALLCVVALVNTRLALAAERRERKALERTSRVLEEERRVLNLITGGASLEATLESLTQAMERIAPGCLCSILLLDESKHCLRVGSGGSLPEAYLQKVDGLEIGPEVGSCGSAAFHNRTVVVANIAADARWARARDFVLGFGLRACWSVPIRDSAGAVLGTFAMYHREAAAPSPSDLRLVEMGAHLAGNAIARLAAEQKLHDSAQRMRQAERAAGIGVWELDGEEGAITLSEGAAALHGLGAQAMQMTIAQLRATMDAEDLKALEAATERAEATGEFEAEFKVRLADGSVRWLRNRGRTEPGSGNGHMSGAVIDVTREKKMLDQLRQSAERMRLAEETAGFGVWELDLATNAFSFSEGVRVLHGLPENFKSPADRREYARLMDPGYMEVVDEAIAEAVLKRRPFLIEYPFTRPEGVVWRRIHGRVEFEGEHPSRLIGATLDITAPKKLTQELNEGAERMRLAEQAAGFGIYEISVATGRMLYSNGWAALSAVDGEQHGSLSPEECLALVHPDDREAVTAGITGCLMNGGELQLEFRVTLPGGRVRWHRDLARAWTENGKPVRLIGASLDITREKEMLDELRESAERMRLAEQAAEFGVWEADLRRETMVISPGFAALNQMPAGTPNELSFAEFQKLIHPGHREAMRRAVEEAYRTRQPFVAEFAVILPDGSERWWRTRGGAEFVEDRPVRVIAATLDVTEQHETLLRLEKAREAAEAGARIKSEFLASMSHEIRTPMNGVIGMTGLLLDSPLNSAQREYAETVRSSSEALLTVINEILDFSKIEAGKLTIESFPFDLRLVVEEVFEMFGPTAEEKRLHLVLQYPSTVPTHFVGDADRIRQVLTNLVGNALKFTATGHILVSVKCVADGQGRARVTVAVTDTGIGIRPDKIGILFEKFSQADSSITRRYGGTGLGLAICKKLVELMGGSIRAESLEGRGSTFTFDLDLALGAQPDPVPVAFLKGLRVLIVDDIEVNRRVVREQITSFGMRNGAYASGEEALAALRRARAQGDPYDIVIADFQMPGIDGATLAATIKSDTETGHPVFIMLSSIGDWREVSGLEGTCVDACLVKPVRQSRLLGTLSEAWSKKHCAGRGSAFAALKQNPARAFAPSNVRILVVEDNPVNQRVAQRLLERIGARADIAGNGQEALELLRALPYDIVFMDCQMPEMDGYEASQHIRRMEGPNRGVKIIALTADAISGSRERCLEAGMDGFIAKPVKLDDFIGALRDRLVLQEELA